MLSSKSRRVTDGNTVRLSSKYDKFDYNCTFNAPNGERLTVYVQIPKGFEGADDVATFSKFEELLLCFNTISSLDLILEQLKFIKWEDSTLAKSPRIELCAFKKVQGTDVLYLKILEKNGKRLEYVQPTEHCIMVVNRNKSWECYDEKRNFQVFSSRLDDIDNIEVIADTELDKSKAWNKRLLFKNIAETIYKQNFWDNLLNNNGNINASGKFWCVFDIKLILKIGWIMKNKKDELG